jgi:hypothetical protein
MFSLIKKNPPGDEKTFWYILLKEEFSTAGLGKIHVCIERSLCSRPVPS